MNSPTLPIRSQGPRVFMDYDYHEIKETLASPYGLLGRAALEMMGITLGAVPPSAMLL